MIFKHYIPPNLHLDRYNIFYNHILNNPDLNLSISNWACGNPNYPLATNEVIIKSKNVKYRDKIALFFHGLSGDAFDSIICLDLNIPTYCELRAFQATGGSWISKSFQDSLEYYLKLHPNISQSLPLESKFNKKSGNFIDSPLFPLAT